MLQDFVKLSRAISDETRVRILKLLGKRELCVCQLMFILEMGQSTVSKHLGILKNAGLVDVRKEWTWSFYKLSEGRMNKFNHDFLKLLSSALEGDFLILKDEERLREVNNEDIKALCNTGKRK
jgi:ArsR family transcriptional regulator